MAVRFNVYLFSVIDTDSAIMPGARLYFYETDSSTPLATYADPDLAVPNPNPVEADASGRFPDIWLQPQAYKVQFTDPSGVVLDTLDPIDGANTPSDGVVTADSLTDDPAEAAAITNKLMYAAPFDGSVPRSLRDKMADFVSVKDFGATGDGSTDDTAAIVAAYAASPWVVFPAGQYNISSNIRLPTTGRMVGLVPQSQHNGAGNEVSIYGKVTDFGSGNPMFTFSPSGSSSQSFVVENMQVRGDLGVDINNLSAMSSSGVVGFDVAGAKNGIDFIQCTGRNLQHFIDQIAASPYTDKITLDRVHVIQCYRAIRANPPAGISLTNSQVFDCFDWIDCTTYVKLEACSFNNSSFASEDTAISAFAIEGSSVWIEGGNNVFQPSGFLKLSGGYMSETFSASGSTKFLIKPQGDNVAIDLSGVRVPTNTRLINFANVSQPELLALKTFGLYGGVNFGTVSDIRNYLLNGLNYDGWGNINSPDWNIVQRNAGLMLGRFAGTHSGSFAALPRFRRFMVATNGTFTINVSPDFVANGSTQQRHEYVKIQLLGDDDGAGGGSAFEATLTIHKGFGAVWEQNITGTDPTAWTVSLSSATATSVQVQITKNHSGTGAQDTFSVFAASENVRITF